MTSFLDVSRSARFVDGESSYPEEDDYDFERVNCYLYKGEQKTWRVGPDPTKCDCWMVSDCEAATFDEFFTKVLECHDEINWLEYRSVRGEIDPTEFRRFLIKHHYADKYANEYSVSHSASSPWKQPLIGFWDRRESSRFGEPDYLMRRCRMPRDRTWCPEGKPRTPTPTPSPEPVIEVPVKRAPTPEPLSDNTYVYLYHLGGRWRIGPDYRDKDCWLFTKKMPKNGAERVNRTTQWYRVDDNDQIVRTSVEIAQLDQQNKRIPYFAETPEFPQRDSKPLPKNVSDNLLGAYTPHRAANEVWYHGPIMWKGKRLQQFEKDVKDDEMVFIGDRNINPWKNVHNAGVTGYYDLVRGRCMGSTDDMLYIARHTTRPEYQKIYIYRLGKRWVVGPQRGGDQSKVWLYSENNDTHVTDPKLKWVENVKGETRKSHKNIKVYPCGVKSAL